MPISPIQPSPADLLSSLTVVQLKDRIRELNSNGHAITLTGNHDILVGRIRAAESPSISSPLPTLSSSVVRNIDVQVALAATADVNSEATKAYAAGIMSSLSVLAKEIKRTFDGNKENWQAQVASARKGLNDAKKLESKFLGPVTTAIGCVNDRISSFELERHNKVEAERLALLQQADRFAQEMITERILNLEDSGDSEGAQRLEQMLDDGSIAQATIDAASQAPIVAAVKVKGVSTRFVWRWRLIDMDNLNPKFILKTVDGRAITAAVKAHETGAYDVVGWGAIEIWEEATTRSTGR